MILKIKNLDKYLFYLFFLIHPIVTFLSVFLHIDPKRTTTPFFLLYIAILSIYNVLKLKLYWDRVMKVLVILFFYMLIQLYSLQFSQPLVFILFCLTFYNFIATSTIKNELGVYFRKVFYYYLYFSILLIPFDAFWAFESKKRFASFFNVAAYCAFVLTSIYIAAYDRRDTLLKKTVNYVLIFIIIILTNTRLPVFVLLIFPFILLFIKSNKSAVIALFISFFISANIYTYYNDIKHNLSIILTYRYKDGRDYSAETRLQLNNMLDQLIETATPQELIFGRGVEYARRYTYNYGQESTDFKPHNDISKMLVDYGLLGSFLFYLFLYYLYRKNSVSLALYISYILSGYDNYFFSYVMISTLIINYFIQIHETD